jgi:hypothetical protein
MRSSGGRLFSRIDPTTQHQPLWCPILRSVHYGSDYSDHILQSGRNAKYAPCHFKVGFHRCSPTDVITHRLGQEWSLFATARVPQLAWLDDANTTRGTSARRAASKTLSVPIRFDSSTASLAESTAFVAARWMMASMPAHDSTKAWTCHGCGGGCAQPPPPLPGRRNLSGHPSQIVRLGFGVAASSWQRAGARRTRLS